jgi:hypothetical protein
MPSLIIEFEGTPVSGESAKNTMKPQYKKSRSPEWEAANIKKRGAGKCPKCGMKMNDCECEEDAD